MDEVMNVIRTGIVAVAELGAIQGGLPREAIPALKAMKPNQRYRLDTFPHPEGAIELIRHGLAHDISSDYAGSIRGATLSVAGDILRGAIYGADAD